MEHETYGKEAAWVVVDGAGKLAVDHVRNGFDQEVKRKLEEYLHPEKPEEDRQEEIRQQAEPEKQVKPQTYQEEPLQHQKGFKTDKPQPDNWQKHMENGEYLRSAEVSGEQNYDMIDGRKNNGYKAPSVRNSIPPEKKPKGRQSVLAKLHKKQAEIAKRNGKKERQQVAENDMEREQK